MPLPFEALLPYGIVVVMFGITGAGLGTLRLWQNEWKQPRRNLDQWDRQMILRDIRLTGRPRGQTDNPVAPVGFELNDPWRTEKYKTQQAFLT